MKEQNRRQEELREEQGLRERQQAYIEDLGVFFERFGFARTVGRVLGVLLIRSRELSSEELARLLLVSKGSVSVATRALIEWGVVRRVSKPGERQDYFGVEPDAWGRAMKREVGWLTTIREIAERGTSLADPGGQASRRNLEEMHHFFAYLEREYPALLERWESEGKGR